MRPIPPQLLAHGVSAPQRYQQPPQPVVVQRRAPPPPPVFTKGAAHLKAFEDDLRRHTKKFTRAWSSTLGLLEYLDKTKAKPVRFTGMNEDDQVTAAKGKCRNPQDPRLVKYEDPIRALVRAWGTNRDYVSAPIAVAVAPVRSGSLVENANSYAAAWKRIKITDRPTGNFDSHNRPIYDYSGLTQDQIAQVDRDGGMAAGWALGGKPGDHQIKPEYWLKLGKMVLGRKVGRCFSCAAAAAYTLVQDKNFDQQTIEVVGCVDFDHYLVVVGRTGGRNGQITIQKKPYVEIGPASGWGAGAVVVDVWQASHSGEAAAMKASDCRYTTKQDGRYVLFCRMEPASRQAHKKLV